MDLSALAYAGVAGSTVCRAMVEAVPGETVSEQVMFQAGYETAASVLTGGGSPSAVTPGIDGGDNVIGLARYLLTNWYGLAGMSFFKGATELCGLRLPWRAGAAMRETRHSNVCNYIEAYNSNNLNGAAFGWAGRWSATGTSAPL